MVASILLHIRIMTTLVEFGSLINAINYICETNPSYAIIAVNDEITAIQVKGAIQHIVDKRHIDIEPSYNNPQLWQCTVYYPKR